MLTAPVNLHDLRAGFVTTACRIGVPNEEIMGHMRHRSLAQWAATFGKPSSARTTQRASWGCRRRRNLQAFASGVPTECLLIETSVVRRLVGPRHHFARAPYSARSGVIASMTKSTNAEGASRKNSRSE